VALAAVWLLAWLTSGPLFAAEAASAPTAAPASTRPAVRDAAMPRRTPAIVLPSVDELRAAARAEAPRVQAGVALPATSGTAVAPPTAGAPHAALHADVPAGAKAATAGHADTLPTVSVPAVVVPHQDSHSTDRKLAPSRGFLPPLPVTARPKAQLAAPVARTALTPSNEPAHDVAHERSQEPTPQAAHTSDHGPAHASAHAPAHAATEPASPAAHGSAHPNLEPVATEPPAATELVPSHAAPQADKPIAVPELPAADPDSPNPLERLRARLAERLAAVKPVNAASPYELQVSTRAAAHSPAKGAVAAGGHGRAAGGKKTKDKPLGEGEWGYDGEHGPQAWGGLCATGRRQSPIDIRDGLPVALEPIRFDYLRGEFSVVDTGHTVQVNVASGSAAYVNGRRYALLQFHFHRPSEERLDGRRFDMSVHLVHRDDQGRLMVVAVLVQQGDAQEVMRQVFGNLPLEKHGENRARVMLDPADLLPGEQAYYTYMGSLTTPPCSEDVLWVVLRHPVSASPDQIDLFSRLYHNNARPLQQADGRRILQTR
jgi:carbonic anhydrase